MYSGGSFCLLFPAAGKKQEPLRLEESHTPYGEALVDEHATTYENPFKFSGKELDDITGLYDHGARSRDPKVTMWYGVDPLYERYPDMSPYVYCAGNPVKFIDPNGREFDEANEKIAKEIESNINAKILELQEQQDGQIVQETDISDRISELQKSKTDISDMRNKKGVHYCPKKFPQT